MLFHLARALAKRHGFIQERSLELLARVGGSEGEVHHATELGAKSRLRTVGIEDCQIS